MTKLIHGGDIYGAIEKLKKDESQGIDDILDFSANINPFGLPNSVKKAITENLDYCVNYPDPLCRKLTRAISKSENISENHILCGNGAADIIFRLVLAVKPEKAMVIAPTFAEYEIALKTVGCQVTHYYIKENEGFAIDYRIVEYISNNFGIRKDDKNEFNINQAGMIFLCNPNNPTGQLIKKELLLEIITICKEKNILVVIDECFIDFVENYKEYSVKEYIEKCENLIILKAFTKSYAMPGLRLGYCMSSNLELLESMFNAGQPWSVSGVAQIAGIAALGETDYVEKSIMKINKEKQFMTGELKRLGIWHLEPAANYIMLKFGSIVTAEENEKFKDSLLKKGILIRDCSNYKGLGNGYYRIAIKDHQANIRLVEALEAVLINNSHYR